jgi:hypothetical protein
VIPGKVCSSPADFERAKSMIGRIQTNCDQEHLVPVAGVPPATHINFQLTAQRRAQHG